MRAPPPTARVRAPGGINAPPALFDTSCQVEVFITYLTPPLTRRMHETEGSYDLLRLNGLELMEGASLAAGGG